MNSLADTTAVILAGGSGTRLRETLPDIPKALAQINGRPFIAFLLDRLASFGIRRVVFCTGYLDHMIKDNLGHTHGPINLIYSSEDFPLGTAGALANARHLLTTDPVLVMNGDSYCHTDLSPFYDWFQTKGGSAGLLLAQVTDTRRYGKIEMDSAGDIIAFQEKAAGDGPGLINAGVYLLAGSIITRLPRNTFCSLETDIFPGLCGHGLAGFPTGAAFLDIGTPEAYQHAPAFFAALGDDR